MRITGSDEYKHRQLTMWDYLPRDTAEREEITEVCESPRITETDITNLKSQTNIASDSQESRKAPLHLHYRAFWPFSFAISIAII